MDTSQPKSFTAAMKDYFGFKPEQKLGEFVAEIKALNDAEKAFFAEGLRSVGYTLLA
jgi:hypothetical protein